MRRPGIDHPCLLVMLVGSLTASTSVTATLIARAEVAAAIGDDLSVPDPSPSEPVKAAMAFRPASVSAGGTAELVVSIRIARAHYLHAARDAGGKFTPLGIEVT